jgi:hypothetical protein
MSNQPDKTRAARSGRSDLGAIVSEVVAHHRFRRKALTVASALVAASVVTSCSAGTSPDTAQSPSPTPAEVTTTSSSPSPSATSASPKASAKPVKKNANYKNFDPKDFGKPTGDQNRWYPLVPGTQSLRDGSLYRGRRKLTHQRRITVTDVTKVVNGVPTVLVLDQDLDAGQVAEAAVEYLAQDKYGNVWYLGSYTEIYDGGQFVNAVDAWLAGKRDAKPGVLMLADPKEGMKYVEASTGRETIRAEVAKVNDRKCVPFECFKSLAILEDGSEFKYYGPDVGHIATEPNYSGGEQEKEELVNVVKLRPKGLAEMSGEAIKLDKHARKEVQSVFGNSQPAERP